MKTVVRITIYGLVCIVCEQETQYDCTYLVFELKNGKKILIEQEDSLTIATEKAIAYCIST